MNNVRGKYHFTKHKLEVPCDSTEYLSLHKIEGKRSIKNESNIKSVLFTVRGSKKKKVERKKK